MTYPYSPTVPLWLEGDCTFRGVTMTVSREVARDLLPYDMDLGPQRLTPPGTHPVVLHFNELFRAHMNVPTLLPNMTYHEVLLGVPFTRVIPMGSRGGVGGPFFYMPKLYLDQVTPILGGLLWWGMNKTVGEMTVTDKQYKLSNLRYDTVATLDFEASGDWRPVREARAFDAMRGIMSQPLVMQEPFGLGPWTALSNFDKDWDRARVRPLTTSFRTEQEIVPGMPCRRFPEEGETPGYDVTPLGSFEVRAPWRLTTLRPWWVP